MADIYNFTGTTIGRVAPEKVVKAAIDFDEVIVIGTEEDGSLYVASSTSDTAEIIYRLELAKHHFLNRGIE